MMPKPRFLATVASLSSALALGTAAVASGQGCAGSTCRVATVVSVHVGTVLRLELSDAPLVAVTLRATTPAGFHPAAGPQAVVRSNGRWRLEISAATDTWTPADAGARFDKPAADLQWRSDASAQYAALSTEPVVAAAGGTTAGLQVPVLYRTRVTPASDTPGTYTMVVRYTLVSS